MIKANAIKKSRLVKKGEWKKYVLNLKNKCEEINDYNKAVNSIINDLKKAIRKRVPNKKFAILFSGGIDSLLIAKICKDLGYEFKCYVVGTESCEDVRISEKAAKRFHFPLEKIIIDERAIEESAKKCVSILKTTNPMTIEIGIVLFSGLSRIKEEYIFSGLGSEEIFGGYRRHLFSKNLKKESWKGLSELIYYDFLRDYKIAKYFNKKILTPFLDKEVIIHSMNLPDDFKIRRGFRKYILKDVGIKLGLGAYAKRKKKAAQYGSNVSRVFERIAKKANAKTKTEYLKGVLP